MKNSGTGIRRKMMFVMLPVILVCNLFTFVITNVTTSRIIRETAETNMRELADSTRYEIAAVMSRTLGIMENVKNSVEGSCETTEDVQKYIYGVADAYPDLIPTGIYCGMTDGTYIDKLWTPGDDWVLEERPWYIDGLNSDVVTLGETYMDAQTREYVVSAYSNIKNKKGELMGVVCADVALDEINEILTGKTLYESGYVYAVDTVTGMVFSNRKDDLQNGQLVTDLVDPISSVVSEMITTGEFGKLVISKGIYILSEYVPESNFIIVCVAPEEAVLSAVQEIRLPMILATVVGCVLISLMMLFILRHFLKPVKQIMSVIDSMAEMDLTVRTSISSKDEFGAISEKINSFADSLRTVVLKIEDAIGAVDKRANTNETAASRLGALAGRQNTSVEELEQMLSDMAREMVKLLEKAETLGVEISNANTAAGEMTRQLSVTTEHLVSGQNKVQEMTETMTGISQISEELQSAVNNMREGLDGIKNMVDDINAVASQTNLLSLNASIEAARAGEAGNGFAVVAAEIRTLADQTADSAVKIVETTSELENLVNEVTRAASGSIERIQTGSGIVESTNSTFNELRESMLGMKSAIVEVSQSLGRVLGISDEMQRFTTTQNENTGKILDDCHHMKEIADNFSDEGSEVEKSGKELKNLSIRLDETVEMFKV